MATIYDALVDSTRRQILDLLRERPRMVCELVDQVQISQPLMSKHLKVLREVGLVTVRQDAQRRWYELQPEPLAEVDAWLASYRSLLEARLNRLDDYLNTLQNAKREGMPDDER